MIIIGDALDELKKLPAESVDCVVTSPPYWGLRDYGIAGQLGREATPQEYVDKMVEIFYVVKAALKPQGTLWLNLGDSYAHDMSKGRATASQTGRHEYLDGANQARCDLQQAGLKPKDLVGIPWRVAFALQQAGWYLRQDIIWHKPNPMPESVRDRCTKSHEYIFLLTKSPRYYFAHEAIQVPAKTAHEAKWAGNENGLQSGESHQGIGKSTRRFGRGGRNAFRGQGHMRDGSGPANRDGLNMRDVGTGLMRNKRSVWQVTTKPFKGAHFATFPPALISPCILAGCPKGGVVLDPFFGAGTTGSLKNWSVDGSGLS